MSLSKLFTYGPDNVDTLLTVAKSVLAEMGPDYLNDQIFKRIPLLDWLKRKGQITKQGGASILVPLLYGKNTTWAWYSGLEVIDTTVQEGLTMAQEKWRGCAGSIALVGQEMRQCSGEGKLYDYVKAKTEQALMSGRDQLNADLFASSQVTKKINCLPVMVDATSTVHDVNSTSNSWWQAQVTSSAGSFAGTGLARLRAMRDAIIDLGQKGRSAPDLILTTALIKEYYEAANVPSIRYQNASQGDLGMENLKFSSAVVEFDSQCASGALYMLCSDCLKMVVHSSANFTVGNFVEPDNQDAKVAKVLWQGNLITNNRRALGTITSITA